jgi:4-hydroxy-3-methylbut-2-en-1-yl diphosphate reductase
VSVRRKVWKKSAQIGLKNYSIVVHGKRYHEETRATFSHAKESAPVVVVRDIEEARDLALIILGERDEAFFYQRFADRYSDGFEPSRDLLRIGVVNQTTMLATETQAIANLLRDAMRARFGDAALHEHFADTSDTLCYATNENQNATLSLIADGGDVGIVVGGYNSSNTSHLVELCSERMPTYFITDAGEMVAPSLIRHFDFRAKEELETEDWLPSKRPLDVVLTAGASCPDALLDEVILKLCDWIPASRSPEEVISELPRE